MMIQNGRRRLKTRAKMATIIAFPATNCRCFRRLQSPISATDLLWICCTDEPDRRVAQADDVVCCASANYVIMLIIKP